MDSQALKSRKALREKERERERLSVCDETLICLSERESFFFFFFNVLLWKKRIQRERERDIGELVR